MVETYHSDVRTACAFCATQNNELTADETTLKVYFLMYGKNNEGVIIVSVRITQSCFYGMRGLLDRLFLRFIRE
jgi:hypothetical protein